MVCRNVPGMFDVDDAFNPSVFSVDRHVHWTGFSWYCVIGEMNKRDVVGCCACPPMLTPSGTLSLKPWSHQYNIFSHEAASLQHAIAQESTASSPRTERHGETVR